MVETTDARKTWFQVITRPRRRLFITLAVFALFIAGVLAGTYWAEQPLWFYVPAIGVLLWWYAAMMLRYRQERRCT
ncbi:hypothetical protein PTQ19_11965 [Microbacterium esteraromaticum]|uniref:hypothetical protein n=1 Tax=Microbacterium esteraromaticum TaxID=57043 RepID=UPI0023689822|nr:hypothetical protein [Microbacterium esteraromaticum]WDH78226.1 hypothetical protein PTQ19_11965 [Microbacterium esteraromaticum]